MEFHTIDMSKFPSTIYKFRDFKNIYHVKSFFDGKIYIPSANEFNDPLDSKIPFRYKDEELTDENIFRKCLQIAKHHYPNKSEEEYQTIAFNNQQKGLLWNEEHLENFDRINYDKICADFGIYCLTTEYDNFLMWSYYSNAHTGFCIGYNTENLIETQIFGMGGPVLYRDDFPKLPLFPTENDHLFIDTFFVKWTVWKHEKEFRLLHELKNGKIKVLPKNVISEVILGVNFPENEKNDFLQKVISKFPMIKVFEMELLTGKFGLKKKLIYDESLIIFPLSKI